MNHYYLYNGIGIEEDNTYIGKGFKIVFRKNLYELLKDKRKVSCLVEVPKNENNTSFYQDTHINLHDNRLSDMVKQFILDTICTAVKNKRRDNIFDYVYDEMTQYDVCLYVYIMPSNTWNNSFSDTIKVKVIHNSWAIVRNGYLDNPDVVNKHAEKFGTKEANMNIDALDYTLEHLVKSVISKHFKFCFKNGKLQIPDDLCPTNDTDFVNRIKSYQDNARGNVNKSLESKIMSKVVKDRKDFAYSFLDKLESEVYSSQQASWKDHHFEIANRSNVACTKQFIMKHVFRKSDGKLKTNAEIIKVTEQEIREVFCDYYESELKRMLATVNACRGEG